jgi:hypothetical protein
MGYRGKLDEQHRARELRGQAWTLNEIASELGVARSSVSVWVRDIAFDESVRAARARQNHLDGNHGARLRGPNKLARRKQAEIARLLASGHARIGPLTDRDLLIAGTALYAGEGTKRDGTVAFANSDPAMVRLFCAWLRRFFDIDESRLRVSVYLHEGLDLDAAEAFWSATTGVPRSQFLKAYRAVPDPSIRQAKHPMGCVRVAYARSATHREIMGLVRALLSSESSPSGVAQSAEQGIVNPKVVGSSPTPGANS